MASRTETNFSKLKHAKAAFRAKAQAKPMLELEPKLEITLETLLRGMLGHKVGSS